MKKIVSGAIIVFLMMSFGYVSYIAYLSYSGYCFKEKRFLSDKERIRIVVKEILTREPIEFDFDKKQKRLGLDQKPLRGHVIPYRDMDDFFTLNPGCCEITTRCTAPGGEREDVTIWEKLTGATHCFVNVRYLQRYRDNDGIEHARQIDRCLNISNCGYVWDGI